MSRDWILVATPAKQQCDRTADSLIAMTAEVYGVNEATLRGPSRVAPLAEARNAISYLMQKHTKLSNTAIAYAMGRTDHTTVTSSLKAAKKRIASNPAFVARLAQIEARLAA